jgi:hypothetical protein
MQQDDEEIKPPPQANTVLPPKKKSSPPPPVKSRPLDDIVKVLAVGYGRGEGNNCVHKPPCPPITMQTE